MSTSLAIARVAEFGTAVARPAGEPTNASTRAWVSASGTTPAPPTPNEIVMLVDVAVAVMFTGSPTRPAWTSRLPATIVTLSRT